MKSLTPKCDNISCPAIVDLGDDRVAVIGKLIDEGDPLEIALANAGHGLAADERVVVIPFEVFDAAVRAHCPGGHRPDSMI